MRPRAKGAFEPVERLGHRFLAQQAGVQIVGDELRHRLGIGIGSEDATRGRQLVTQFAEVLDNAVVHDGDAVGAVGMRVDLVGHAMRRPARVTDPDEPVQGLGGDELLQIDELALGATALDMAVDQRRDTGRIVATIFEALQSLEEQRRRILLPDDTDDAAHVYVDAIFARAGRLAFLAPRAGLVFRGLAGLFVGLAVGAPALRRAAQPGTSFCSARVRPSARAFTSRLITLPAPTTAPAPILTGATNDEFEPMKAPAPMSVSDFFTPS